MPLRAMIATCVTVAIALLAVGMWVAVVMPMLRETDAVSASMGAATMPATVASPEKVPVLQLHALVRSVLIISFVLILLLLLVGLFATSREWMRRKGMVRKKVRTKFVDAWKIAGERAKAEEELPEEPLQ